jgi:hypothetical protein
MKENSILKNHFFRQRAKKNQAALLLAPLLLVSLFALVTCNQDAIFYTISLETEPRDPRIPGTPAEIVQFNDAVFAASSKLHRYAKPDSDNDGTADLLSSPSWDSPAEQPDFTVLHLAATTDYLYALSMSSNGSKNELKRIHKGNTGIGSFDGSWQDVSIAAGVDYTNLQTIHADGQRLFAGARKSGTDNASDEYAILYADEAANTSLHLLEAKTGILSGAVYDSGDHYISTSIHTDIVGTNTQGGIFIVSESSLSVLTPVTSHEETTRSIKGIIGLNAQVAAIDRDGDLLYRNTGDTAFTVFENIKLNNTSIKTTGSLAVWKNYNDNTTPDPLLLLVGIQGSTSSSAQGYINGYREVALTGGKLDPGTASINEPGKAAPSSIDSNDRYVSSIGKWPINSLYQVPYTIDEDMPVFASTQNYGLWSCRVLKGDRQWAAEE